MFESVISLGNIISIFLTLIMSAVVVTGFVWAIRSSVKVIDVRLVAQSAVVAELKDEVKKLAQVVTVQAVQNQRLDGFDEVQHQFERRIVLQGERLDRLESRVNSIVDSRSEQFLSGRRGAE